MSIEAILQAVVAPNTLNHDATLIEQGARSMQIVYAMSKFELESGFEMQVSDFRFFLQSRVGEILNRFARTG
jgi:hypothetical protein